MQLSFGFSVCRPLDSMHPAVLDLAMVVGYYRVELTWGLSFLFRHNVAVSSDFIKYLFQFVVLALLGRG